MYLKVCYVATELCRMESLEVNASSIKLKVKKFNVTLEQQVSGVLPEHTVMISEMVGLTRTQRRKSLPSQYDFTCTCQSKKAKCIHIGLVASQCFQCLT